MEITDRRVATVHYTLTDDAGQVIYKSPADAPLIYLHGGGKLMPGLEKALVGKKTGARFLTDVAPEDAYGPRHERLVQVVPRSAFEGVESLQPGMQFLTETAEGPLLATVLKVNGDRITVDGNHSLAGQNLHFDLEVVDVREATAEEIERGDVSGTQVSAP
jgi:FKBP-type peptidyl-prolyl cis-trans isomerase SlyD